MKLLRLSRSRFHGFHALYSRWWAGALRWPFWTRPGEASPSAERVLLCLCTTASAGLLGARARSLWRSNVLLQCSRDIQALLFSYEPAVPVATGQWPRGFGF